MLPNEFQSSFLVVADGVTYSSATKFFRLRWFFYSNCLVPYGWKIKETASLFSWNMRLHPYLRHVYEYKAKGQANTSWCRRIKIRKYARQTEKKSTNLCSRIRGRENFSILLSFNNNGRTIKKFHFLKNGNRSRRKKVSAASAVAVAHPQIQGCFLTANGMMPSCVTTTLLSPDWWMDGGRVGRLLQELHFVFRFSDRLLQRRLPRPCNRPQSISFASPPPEGGRKIRPPRKSKQRKREWVELIGLPATNNTPLMRSDSNTRRGSVSRNNPRREIEASVTLPFLYSFGFIEHRKVQCTVCIYISFIATLCVNIFAERD